MKMGIIKEKFDELRVLLIGKEFSEQKDIVIKFFFENREKDEHFKRMYEPTKLLFEESSLSDFTIQEFIEKTFINPEIMISYPIWEIIEEEFDDLTERQKETLRSDRK